MRASDPILDALTFSGLVPWAVGLAIYVVGLAAIAFIIVWQVRKASHDKAAWQEAQRQEYSAKRAEWAKYEADLAAWQAAQRPDPPTPQVPPTTPAT